MDKDNIKALVNTVLEKKETAFNFDYKEFDNYVELTLKMQYPTNQLNDLRNLDAKLGLDPKLFGHDDKDNTQD